VGRGPGGLTTPGAYRGDRVEAPGPPQATWGTRGPEMTRQAQQQLPKAHDSRLGGSGKRGGPRGRGKQTGAKEELSETKREWRLLDLRRG
jgi:hypothetical protein